jgi:FAD/FMN-containing dehydrogenase
MRPYVSRMAYQNYIDPAQPHWQQAYYGANYARLESIRKTVDPHHLFNFPQAIGR